MKAIAVVALLLACANASVVDKIRNLVPSFATPYVIEGEPATPGSAPFIVSLSNSYEKHSHTCGGTIISKEWVITAAHCITASKVVGMSVYAGLHERLEVEAPTAQHRQVDFGKIHASYTGGVGPYDIAILHVSEPFEFNKSVQPAVIPQREHISSGPAVLYGWGQTKYWLLTAAKTLQTVETEILEWEKCKEVLPEDAPLDKTNVCTSTEGTGKGACNGDSGGPLVQEVEDGPSELVGVVSWGYIPCGVSKMPSIFTRSSAYIDWIADIESAYYKLY